MTSEKVRLRVGWVLSRGRMGRDSGGNFAFGQDGYTILSSLMKRLLLKIFKKWSTLELRRNNDD